MFGRVGNLHTGKSPARANPRAMSGRVGNLHTREIRAANLLRESPARAIPRALAAAVACAALATLTVAPALAVGGGAAAASPLIAFERNSPKSQTSTIWVADADGSHARKLGNGDLPLISPNGAIVAAGESAKLTTFSTAGGLAHTFPAPDRALPEPLAWSPDSRYLVVGLQSDATNGITGAGLGVIDTTDETFAVIAKGVIYGASFAVNGTDAIVYASANSQLYSAPVNLHTIAPDGAGATQITSDGHSLAPVWGAKGIVFDHEQFVKSSGQEDYQLWLRNGTTVTQLTHMKIPPLLDGLVPIGFSADGNRLIAAYTGTDTDTAWTVQISPLRVRQVSVNGQTVQAGAISRNGDTLLVDGGAFEDYADAGTIETVPFTSSHPAHKLDRGAFPTWNG